MDRVKVCAAICRSADKVAGVRPHQARLPTASSSSSARRASGRRPSTATCARPTGRRTLKDFTEGKLHVLVATDVAARGLHIDAVDVVIHFDPPEDHKAYLHRSGRTARAGSAGLVVSLVQWNQILEIERIQTRIGVRMPIVEMFSNDPRLADLAAWTPRRPEPEPGRPDRRRAGHRRPGPSDDPRSAACPTAADPDRRRRIRRRRPDPGGHRPPGRRRLRRRRLGRRLDRRGDRGRLLHRHRRRRRRVRPHRSPGPRWPPSGARSSWRRPGRGGDRRDVPRLPRRAGDRRASNCARHLPGDPPVRPDRVVCPVARAELGPDLRQPSRPPGHRRGGGLRRLPRRPQPVRLPRAPRGGPRAPHRARAVDDGHRAGQPGGGRHRRLRPEAGRAPLPPQPGRATGSTSTSCCGAGWAARPWPPACPRVAWPRPSTW